MLHFMVIGEYEKRSEIHLKAFSKRVFLNSKFLLWLFLNRHIKMNPLQKIWKGSLGIVLVILLVHGTLHRPQKRSYIVPSMA